MSTKGIISDWFHQYSHDIYEFLVYYMGTSDVEDCVQEVFIKAMKGIDRFKHESSPKTWLISIARNVAIDEIRKRNRKGLNSLLPLKGEVTISNQTPEKLFEDHENKQSLYEAILSLKQSYRDVVILRGIKELDTAETASILNWKEDKVRTTYHRALKALRKSQGGFLV